MAVNLGQAVGYLDLDTSKFSRGFKTAWSDMQTFMDKTQTASTRVQALGSAMGAAGRTMTTTFTVPLVAVGTVAVATAAKFEAAMSEVKAISGATGSSFDALVEKAKYMGATTKFTAVEAAEGLKYMGMAGWNAQQMLDGLPGVMYLAAASGEDLGTVSDIVTDALTAFGLQASDSAHFADVLAVAAAKSNTNVGMLGESFKYVAPVAGAFGYSVEDTATLLGVMANNGIKASQAGTTLRQILLGLQGGVTLTGQAFGEYDLNIANADGSMRDLGDVTVELRQIFSQMTDEEKAMNAEMIAGQRGISGLLSIVNTSDQDFNILSSALNNSAGAAQSMAETMQDNLIGQLTILKSGAEGLAIAFGNTMMPAIKQVITWLQQLTDWLNNLNEDQRKTIVTVAAVVAAVGPALRIGSKIIALYTSVTTRLTAVHAAMNRRRMDLIEEASAYAANSAAGNLNLTSKLKGQAATLVATASDKLHTMALNAKTAAEAANTAAQNGGILAKAKAAIATVTATVANGAYTVGAGAATVATTIFNAALTAIPFVAVAAAIIAVVAGLVKLISWLANGSKANQEYKQAIKEVNEQHDELKQNMDESAKSFDAVLPSIAATTAQSNTYLDKIQELQGALANMSAEERANSSTKRELQVYIDRLNDSQEGLNLAYDEETGLLNQDVEAVRSMIAAKEQLAIANAYQERANEVAKELVDIDTELYKIAQLRVEIMEDEALSERERTSRLADLEESELAYMETRDEVNANLTAITEQQVALETEAAEATVENFDAQGEALQRLSEQYGIGMDEISAQMEANGQTAEEWAQQQEELTQQVQEAYDGYFEQVTNGFEVMTQKSAISLDEFMDNMRKNQEATQNWADNMSTLMDAGVNAGVIAQLEKLGPAGAEQAQAFVDELTELNGGVDISLGNLNEAAQAKLDELEVLMGTGAEAATAATEVQFNSAEFIASGGAAFDAMALEIGANTTVEAASVEVITGTQQAVQQAITGADFSGIGKTISDGLKTGITQGKTGVTNEAKTVIRDTKTAATSQVTASDFKATGKQITTDVKTGITTGKTNVTNEMKTVIRDTNTAATTQINASDFKASGTKMTTDIKTGITSGKSGLESEIRAAITAAKSAGDSQVSSSNFSSIGKAIADGVKAGIEAGASGVVNAAVKMVQDAAAAAKRAAEIASPSKLFKNAIGLQLPKGAALGILDGIKYVVSAITDMMDAAEEAALGSTVEIVGDPDLYGNPGETRYDGNSDTPPQPAPAGGDTFQFFGTEPLDKVGTERAFRQAQRERAANLL